MVHNCANKENMTVSNGSSANVRVRGDGENERRSKRVREGPSSSDSTRRSGGSGNRVNIRSDGVLLALVRPALAKPMA